MNAMTSEQQNRETFFAAATRHLNGLYEYVRHQLAYLEASGELERGEFTAEDVIDSVLVRAYHEFVKAPGERDIGKWLIDLAGEHLQRQVRRSQAERRRHLPIEKDIPEVIPTEAVKTLGEEILDFYQPDEDLKLEDIFPEYDVSTPEDFVAAEEELVHCVNAALAAMPEESRKAFNLHHRERLTLQELGEVLDKNTAEIEDMLEYARRHLRQHLIDSGCSFIVKGGESRSKSAAPADAVPGAAKPHGKD
jgi:RNA polymerase sigma factor (sigma-70 family)